MLDEDGYVILNAQRIEELRRHRALSRKELAVRTDISPHTMYRMLGGKRVQMKTVRKFFQALHIDEFHDYLMSGEASEMPPADFAEDGVLAEWNVQHVLSPSIRLSNDLQFRVCKLTHRVLPNTFGRGKCYDLEHLRTRDAMRVAEQLTRHPSVCRAVGPHPQIPVNERVMYNDQKTRFWVIDRWFDGVTLQDRLQFGPLPPSELARLMTQLLDGLAVLHNHAIIRRELSPRYIVLAEPDGHALFTELELAKLLDGAYTVSETWDEDPYRAPEIEADEIDATVDLYSWAQILIHAATGRMPPSPADSQLLESTALPEYVKRVAVRCLSISHKWRPPTAEKVRETIRNWK